MVTTNIKYAAISNVTSARPTTRGAINPAKIYLSTVTGRSYRAFMTFGLPDLSQVIDTTLEDVGDKFVYNDITEVLLKLTLSGAWSGTQTIHVQATSQPWSVSTMTWNKSGLTVHSPSVSQVITSGVSGQVITLDVTSMIKALKAYGGTRNWYGFRILITGASAARGLVGNAKAGYPYLSFSYERRPDTPTVLTPGSFSEKVSTSLAQPDLSVGGTSLIKDGTLSEMQVMISPVNTEPVLVNTTQDGTYFSATSYDSGAISTDTQTIVWSALPATDAGGTALPSLSDGQWVKWIARVKDSNGNWSKWSPVVTLWREAKPTVTFVTPASSPSNFVQEYTPTIDWTVSGATQASFRVTIFEMPQEKLIYDSGQVSNTTSEHQIAVNKVFPGTTYKVKLKLFDTESTRVTGFLDGVPDYNYVEIEREFTYQGSGAVSPVTDLVAENPEPYPWIDVTWKRAVEPDSFLILRDGLVVSDATGTGDGYLLPEELEFTAPDEYLFRDYTVGTEYGVSHTYSVIANVGSADSASNPTDEAEIEVGIAWLIDKANDIYVPIAGPEPVDMNLTEVGTTHSPLNSAYPVRITSSKKQYSGSVNGVLCGECLKDGTTSEDLQNLLLDMREESPDVTFRLLIANVNIPVVIYDISTFPLYGARYGKSFGVTFNFHQVAG